VVYGLECDLSGLGCVVYRSGRLDVGHFLRGSLENEGKVLFASGDIYQGGFVNGQFEGAGFKKYLYC
jgi:hypothetical protein